jgi:gamma-tubulin complex component 2
MFATSTAQLSRSLQLADPGLLAEPGDGSPLHQESPFHQERLDKMDAAVNRYETNFSRVLKIFVDALNYYAATESVALLGLLSSLDWDWNRE